MPINVSRQARRMSLFFNIPSKIIDVAPELITYQSYIFFYFAIPMFILNLMLSTWMGYISGAGKSNYNLEDDWQGCLIAGDFGQYSYITGATYQSIRIFLMSILSIIFIYRGLYHPELIPSSLAFCTYALICSVAYFNSSYIVPDPTETDATLVNLTKFIRKDMYDDVNDGVNNCNGAFIFNIVFLVVQYISVFVIIANIILGIKAELIRRKFPRSSYYPLSNTFWPLIVVYILAISYIIVSIVKGDATVIILEDGQTASYITNYDLPTPFFPFKGTSLDVTTILLPASAMSVFRGYTLNSISAFRVAAIASLIEALTDWPVILSTFNYFKVYDLWDYDSCKDYFYQNPKFGFPDNYTDAENLCVDTYISFFFSFLIFILCHIQVVLCFRCYFNNRDRRSEVFEPSPRNSRAYTNLSYTDPLIGKDYVFAP